MKRTTDKIIDATIAVYTHNQWPNKQGTTMKKILLNKKLFDDIFIYSECKTWISNGHFIIHKSIVENSIPELMAHTRDRSIKENASLSGKNNVVKKTTESFESVFAGINNEYHRYHKTSLEFNFNDGSNISAMYSKSGYEVTAENRIELTAFIDNKYLKLFGNEKIFGNSNFRYPKFYTLPESPGEYPLLLVSGCGNQLMLDNRVRTQDNSIGDMDVKKMIELLIKLYRVAKKQNK